VALKIQSFPKWVLSAFGITNSLSAGYRPTLQESVVPVVVCGSYEGYDPQFLKKSQQAAGGAGTNTEAELFNPLQSGVYALIRRATVRLGAAAGTVDFRAHTAALGNNLGGGYLRRAPRAVGSQCLVSNAIPAAIDGTSFLDTFSFVSGSQDTVIPQLSGFRLDPGSGLVIGNNTQNELLAVTFEWDELAL
jgi:hypothetical protein